MPDVWEVDAIAADLRARAGVDPDEPILVTELARALGVPVRIVPHGGIDGDAELRAHNDGWVIVVRRGLPRPRARFDVAHELAEWALRGVIDERIEDACNAIAAAILAPRRAFLRWAYEVGETSFEQLALPFGLTQTAAALRSAETGRFPLALARPGLLRLRAPEDFVWGASEEQIGQWARGTPRPGLRKVAITDEPRRSALVLDEEQLAFGGVLDETGSDGW